MRGAIMKKGNLWSGLLFTAAGIALLLTVFLGVWDSSLLSGFGGGALGAGLGTLVRYFYWSSPKCAERYREKLERESIEGHDELLERLRDRSGRYAYILGMLVAGVSIVAAGILRELGIVENTRMLIIYLGAYLLFQFVSGIVIYRRLKRRY